MTSNVGLANKCSNRPEEHDRGGPGTCNWAALIKTALFGADSGEVVSSGIKNEDGNKQVRLPVILKTTSGPMMND